MSAAATPGPWTSLLGATAVREVLARSRVLAGVHPVGEVGSTQDLAASLAATGARSGTVVVADRQIAGRGRVGRTWDDRPGGGTLAITVLLDVGHRTSGSDPVWLGIVPHALGLAVLRACERTVPEVRGLGLKWPNDLVHRPRPGSPSRKVSGVLVERERVGSPPTPREVLLCGVGINVDLGVDPGAGGGEDRTCLRALAGRVPDRTVLVAALLDELDEVLVRVRRDPDGLLDAHRAASDTIGRRVRVEVAGRPPHVGLAEDVDGSGRLVLRTGTGRHAILSGTVRDAEDPGGTI